MRRKELFNQLHKDKIVHNIYKARKYFKAAKHFENTCDKKVDTGKKKVSSLND